MVRICWIRVNYVPTGGGVGVYYRVVVDLREEESIELARYSGLSPNRIAKDLRRVCGNHRVTAMTETE